METSTHDFLFFRHCVKGIVIEIQKYTADFLWDDAVANAIAARLDNPARFLLSLMLVLLAVLVGLRLALPYLRQWRRRAGPAPAARRGVTSTHRASRGVS